MSSLARRTLRTTAAAAGMAALGVGLAGNALAAADDAEQAPEPLTSLPAVAQSPGQLPMLFVFKGPTVNTAGPATAEPGGPQVAHAETDDDTDTGDTEAGDTEAGDTGVEGAGTVDADAERPVPSYGTDRVGALSSLDTAGIFDALASQRLVNQGGPGSGNSVG